MSRRASSTVHPLWILAAVVLLIGSIAGGYFLYKVVSDPYRTIAPLDVAAYMENANSLRGNIYKLDATISSQLAWTPAAGKLYSVEVDSGNVLPVMIPAQFNSVNLQKGQHYFLQIEVIDKGILKLRDLKKA
jgi:hypothetical protein